MKKNIQPPKKMEIKNIQTPKELLSQYMRDDSVGNFGGIPMFEKLTMLQTVPDSFIKTREVGGKEIPYVTHEFAEKALNFVFNFRVSNEIKNSKIEEIVLPSGKKCWEAECMVEFTFRLEHEEEIKRTVFSSHRLFPNPAITRGDTLKSAISKSWTVVARTFGIGSNLAKMEEQAYRQAEQDTQQEQPPKKNFSNSAPY